MLTFRTRSIGWALFGVNFGPLQEIEAIMGGKRIFDTGPISQDYGKKSFHNFESYYQVMNTTNSPTHTDDNNVDTNSYKFSLLYGSSQYAVIRDC